MRIEKDRVVVFHYSLSDESGAAIESSRGAEPLAILHGHGNIIAGLEQAMSGRAAGETFSVSVPPEQGYGPRREDFTQRIPKKYFRNGDALKPGMSATLGTQDGPRTVIIMKVGSSVVDVDLNHPMAGKTLNFDIEITDVREASAEEIVHRHVHGPGGHHH
jgi:FKBP-type peptidyl-prolyl cis-trans isomerase SlyD